MRIIGVVDLLAGRAVHARAGQRDTYQPVATAAGVVVDGDALALARMYVDRLGLTELYAADLDAIAGRLSQDALAGELAAIAPLWLDAGVTSAGCASRTLALGARHVIVGLETLDSYDTLGEICSAAGSDRVAFSLDLREGVPLVAHTGGLAAGEPPHVVATRAAQAGAGSVIVLDLARVGTGSGLDLDLLRRIREAIPEIPLLAGGGVRGPEDLARLAAAGCDGALVATALHDGRIGVSEIAAAGRHASVSR